MADKREQQQETESTDTATVDTGAGDDEVVVVQQGDDLVSYQGGAEVGRRPIIEDDSGDEQADTSARERGDASS